MDGVTILSEMSVREVELWKVIIWGIVTAVYVCYMILDHVEGWRYLSWPTRIVEIICTLMVFAIMSFVEIVFIYGYHTFKTEYKATIDDSVSFKEFNKRYEILSQDGDIYTVIEKELADETN